MKIRTMLFALGLSFVFPGFSQISVTPGSRMPEIEADFIGKKPQARGLPSKNRVFVEAILFFDADRPDSMQVLRMADSLAQDFPDTGKSVVRLMAICPDTQEHLLEVLKSSRFQPGIPVGTDQRERTFRNYAVAQVPYAFIGKDGAVLWSGHPADLEYVISNVVNGTYSVEKYRVVSQYRKEIQAALRSGLPEVAARTAEKALEKTPGDTLALQARLYAFQVRDRYGEAAEYLTKHLQKYPEADRPGIRLLQLDLILRSGEMTHWKKAVSAAVRNVLSKPVKANDLAAFLLDRTPDADLPVAEILLLTDTAVKGLAASPRRNAYADALEIRAKAFYRFCRLAQAVALQKQAVEIRTKQKDLREEDARKVLQFYQSLEKLPLP